MVIKAFQVYNEEHPPKRLWKTTASKQTSPLLRNNETNPVRLSIIDYINQTLEEYEFEPQKKDKIINDMKTDMSKMNGKIE